MLKPRKQILGLVQWTHLELPVERVVGTKLNMIVWQKISIELRDIFSYVIEELE